MAISLSVVTAKGQQLACLEDPDDRLSRVLPSPDDETFPLLRFVDPYGYTVFNRVQLEALESELDRLLYRSDDRPTHDLLASVVAMARRCREEPHLYLRFEGD